MKRLATVTAFGLLAALAPKPARAGNCGELLVVLDRSGSMARCVVGGQTKEDIAKKALNAIIGSYPSVAMGLAVFPDTLTVSPLSCDTDLGNACNVGKVVIDLAADGGSKIKTYLASMPRSCGGTPTAATLQVISGYNRWTTGRDHFVLFLTDGQPTCQDGEDGGEIDQATQMCKPAAVCNGQGACRCKNPTKAYDAIQAMAQKGIHTFVVGFEGVGVGAGCADGKPFDPNVLDQMATLGGEPQGPPATTKYYSAVDEASLGDALRKILGRVGGGTVGGCTGGGGQGGGAGGGGSDAGGGGAGGGSDGGAGAGGQGGSGGNPSDDAGSGGKSPSCTCTAAGASAPGTPGAVGVAAAFGLLAGVAGRSGRRRRRQETRS